MDTYQDSASLIASQATIITVGQLIDALGEVDPDLQVDLIITTVLKDEKTGAMVGLSSVKGGLLEVTLNPMGGAVNMWHAPDMMYPFGVPPQG